MTSPRFNRLSEGLFSFILYRVQIPVPALDQRVGRKYQLFWSFELANELYATILAGFIKKF